MEHHLFNVIFTGHLIDGFESYEVIKSFSSKFKIPEAKARKIILAQKLLVLKPRAEHIKAYKFKSALESIGMEVKLERAMMAAPKAPVATTKQTEKKPVKHTAAQPNNIADPKPGESAGSASWSLEPIEEKPTETADESEPTANVHPAYQRQQIDETESNTTDQTEHQENNSQAEQHEHNTQVKKPLGELIKTIGGVAVGIVGILLIAVKKFGLFKFLKIGGLMTAAAFAGYEAEEVCMGNGLCEDAIDEQIDDCWEQSGFEDHDWENMSDEQYFSLKPKIENEFIGCFVYEDTGQRVLESPIEVRFDLIDNCYQMGRNDCLMLAESQLKSCYAANNIAQLIPADTMNFYQAVIDHPDAFKNYYSCFVDANGGPLFAEILQNWDVLYYPEY